MVGNSLAGKGHAVPGDGQDGHHEGEDGDGGHHGHHEVGGGAGGHDDENLSAISLRASPRTLSDWWREASALKEKYHRHIV